MDFYCPDLNAPIAPISRILATGGMAVCFIVTGVDLVAFVLRAADSHRERILVWQPWALGILCLGMGLGLSSFSSGLTVRTGEDGTAEHKMKRFLVTAQFLCLVEILYTILFWGGFLTHDTSVAVLAYSIGLHAIELSCATRIYLITPDAGNSSAAHPARDFLDDSGHRFEVEMARSQSGPDMQASGRGDDDAPLLSLEDDDGSDEWPTHLANRDLNPFMPAHMGRV